MSRRALLLPLLAALALPARAADVARPPLANADPQLGKWAEAWFPWGAGEIGVEKAPRGVAGWSGFRVTKRFRQGFEDHLDVFVSADGKTAVLGTAFLDEARLAAPAPVATDADLGSVRQLLKDRVLGQVNAKLRRQPSRDLPGLRGLEIAIETGYDPYDLDAFVSEKDGALFILGRAWRRDRPIPDQRRDAIDLSATPGEGPEAATVTMVEYSDLECPMCKRRSGELSALIDRLKGDLPIRRYVKTYPLTQIHPWSFRAASAARCFLKKDPRLYFSFRSNVFARQESLDVAGLDAFAYDFAAANGVPDALGGCYLTAANDAPILKDLAEGFALGVRSTPTYFVNGVLLVWMEDNLLEEYLRKTYLGGKGLPLPTPKPSPAPKATPAAKH